MSIVAILACGHWFRESRPVGLAEPVNGEMRACAHPDHYPMEFAAVYIRDLDLTPLGGEW